MSIGTLPNHILNPDPNIYLGDNYVALDFETTTYKNGLAVYPDNRILLAAWKSGALAGSEVTTQWAGEYDLSRLVSAVRSADFIVAHNAKFELQWLERCGLDLADTVVWDTMLGEYVIGGNRWKWQECGLEVSAQRRLGKGKMSVVSKMIKNGISTTDIPESWLEEYCIDDVLLTEELFLAQREYMLEDGHLLPVQFTRCLATPVLASMELEGMQLDADLVHTRLLETEREAADLEQQLEQITGGINTNSGPQLAKFLYEDLGFAEVRKHGKPVRTGKGKPKTDQETISKLRPTRKAQRDFLELYVRKKELNNELTKYLRKFAACIDGAGGLLQAQFNQHATSTHRTSSTGLEYGTQFQNFPRIYKPIFKSRNKDWLMGEADGAQLEFRIAAHLGRCSAAIRDICDGVDVHRATADIIGVSRQDAKKDTFKPLYGGSSGTQRQRDYYAYFKERYEGITRVQQGWIDTVLSTGQLRTECGLVYYWPGTRMDANGYVSNTTSICNYPVQGLATAEVIPVALVYFWHRVRAGGHATRVVNTVHDSIIAEIPPEEIELFHELSQQCLISDVYAYFHRVYGIDFVVPLGCGVKVATHWSGADAPEYVPKGVEHDKGEVVYTAQDSMVTNIDEIRITA